MHYLIFALTACEFPVLHLLLRFLPYHYLGCLTILAIGSIRGTRTDVVISFFPPRSIPASRQYDVNPLALHPPPRNPRRSYKRDSNWRPPSSIYDDVDDRHHCESPEIPKSHSRSASPQMYQQSMYTQPPIEPISPPSSPDVNADEE